MTSPMRKRPRFGSQDDNNDKQYFRSYSDISIHEEMIADQVRTSTYRLAILRNYDCIRGKVVADIGAGTGILSMFCVQAGAKKVYAVEASRMAEQAKLVVQMNKMDDKITVIQGKVEDVELPEKVDVIISEFMGYFLLYESMLPSVLVARDKWLKEDGLMLPTMAELYVAPISDPEIYEKRLRFWQDVKKAYKVDMSILVPYAKKCIADHVHIRPVPPEDVQAHAVKVCQLRLKDLKIHELNKVKSDFRFRCFGHAKIHGFTSWFLVSFPQDVRLSTSPYSPDTHWQQSIVYIDEALPVEQDSEISGSVELAQNAQNKRFLDITFQYRVNSGELQHKHCVMNDYIT